MGQPTRPRDETRCNTQIVQYSEHPIANDMQNEGGAAT
jgi:hypothetical protein